MPQTYAARKRRLDAHPEKKRQLYKQQAESRRRLREKVRAGVAAPCAKPDGTPCWITWNHTHIAGR